MFKKLSAVIMMVVFGVMFQAASVFALEKVVEDETGLSGPFSG